MAKRPRGNGVSSTSNGITTTNVTDYSHDPAPSAGSRVTPPSGKNANPTAGNPASTLPTGTYVPTPPAVAPVAPVAFDPLPHGIIRPNAGQMIDESGMGSRPQGFTATPRVPGSDSALTSGIAAGLRAFGAHAPGLADALGGSDLANVRTQVRGTLTDLGTDIRNAFGGGGAAGPTGDRGGNPDGTPSTYPMGRRP